MNANASKNSGCTTERNVILTVCFDGRFAMLAHKMLDGDGENFKSVGHVEKKKIKSH